MFCVNCGSALSAGAGGAPAAATPMYPPAMPGLPSAWDAERRKQIDRTKTGLLLLLIGGLISWIPLIGIVGGLLLLIGAIFVIIGRKAFGSTHARNVVIAIVLFFVGIVIGIIAGVLFAAAVFSAIASQNPAALGAALGSAFNTLLVGAIIAAVVSGIASVLFTYALQKQTGKMLLWAGYAANLAISIAVFAIIGPLIANAVNQATSGGTYNPAPIVALQGQLSALGYLSVIPALLFAATYLAWSRVSHGEIPPPTTPPGMPMSTMPPPAGPSPPR